LAQRSDRRRRKARRAAAAAAAPIEPPATAEQPIEPELSRTERARDELQPLRPEERPPVIYVASAVAVLLGLANLTLGIAAGAGAPDLVPAIVLLALMGVSAYGTWNLRYWGVLTMQAVLGISIVFSALFLIAPQPLTTTLAFVVLIGLFGWIFWKLVKIMARIQMPNRPTR